MTAQELILQQLEDAGNQLNKVAEGITEAALDYRTTPFAMSPREQFAHLCECYVAYGTQAGGQKYAWGSYQAPGTETSSLLSEFATRRAGAIELVRANASDENVNLAHMYVLAHDYYHIGQMCQARLAVQTDWDPYSIYNS